MILFFDRSIGTDIPKALREYLKPPGVEIEYHQLHFDPDEHDDVWLPQIGTRGWFVIGQDYKYHEKESELAALRTYSVGAFYLWDTADKPKWQTMRVFARAYDKILRAADVTPKPFVFRVDRHGRLQELYF